VGLKKGTSTTEGHLKGNHKPETKTPISD
jgi:hypothetical protein